ncbi:MAG: hypothetical protein A2287_10015 [Candidatus Melainabacteria bacterium RIFOXYA12_FULL_32_12]|nr:MAG: hypothetical protein A2255_00855 [Candidatus Melainabacteria bacterium RIFOXYA2_FULL_32_9]OGI31119.1 MAG: hypothetical protein A2287_10015 [Candidatus Melainabacteria bacterium RIFOXYA12_FULL_32_12]
MGFLDKFALFSISFVLGMVTTSGFMSFQYDNLYNPLLDKKFNFVLENGIESPFSNDKKLECNGKTNPSKIRTKDLSELLMQKELIKLAVFESVTGKSKENHIQGY